MELLLISHKYPPAIGGMEKQSFELIKRMSIKCVVHTIVYDLRKENRLTFFLKLKGRIKAMLKENPKIDLIHLNDGLLAAFTRWLPEYVDIPVVTTFHGLDVVFPLEYYQKSIIPSYTKLASCIAVSESIKNELLKRGLSPEKVYTIKNGVDHEVASPPLKPSFRIQLEKQIGISTSDKKILVTMGRPVKRKGFSWFLKSVFPHLAEDVIFLMIGPYNNNPVRSRLFSLLPKRIKSKLELFFGLASDHKFLQLELQKPIYQNRVFHLGKLPFEEVKQTLSIADLFVMPNIPRTGDAEGFGLVALESVLRGTPVLASNLEGITDAIHNGKNGWLVKPGDKEEWIFKIYELLSDKIKLQQFSDQAERYTKDNFDWNKMVDEYIGLFNGICNVESHHSEGALALSRD
jgi:phosphatidylinositol alpha-1,6-mannosyltransferase